MRSAAGGEHALTVVWRTGTAMPASAGCVCGRASVVLAHSTTLCARMCVCVCARARGWVLETPRHETTVGTGCALSLSL